MATRSIKVKFSIRKGEYGPMARIEFPHPSYVMAVLQVTPEAEQKKYNFHYFDNVLIAKGNTDTIKQFLQTGAKRLDLTLEFVE